MRRMVAAGGLVVLGLALGCAKDGKPPTAPVSGQVTYKGQPVPGGNITFVHSSGQPAAGEIGSDGRYKVTAFVGANRVIVESREAPVEQKGGKPGMMLPGKSRIPEKYESASSSGLTCEVKAGDNKQDFELKD